MADYYHREMRNLLGAGRTIFHSEPELSDGFLILLFRLEPLTLSDRGMKENMMDWFLV